LAVVPALQSLTWQAVLYAVLSADRVTGTGDGPGPASTD
jgi:hypothetical protein